MMVITGHKTRLVANYDCLQLQLLLSLIVLPSASTMLIVRTRKNYYHLHLFFELITRLK
jgi:hypothetical protein